MKAKEYSAKFNLAPNLTTFTEICNMFVRESVSLAKSRKVSTESGVTAVFKEQDNKWRAFCRRAVEWEMDGGVVVMDEVFRSIVKDNFYSVYQSLEW